MDTELLSPGLFITPSQGHPSISYSIRFVPSIPLKWKIDNLLLNLILYLWSYFTKEIYLYSKRIDTFITLIIISVQNRYNIRRKAIDIIQMSSIVFRWKTGLSDNFLLWCWQLKRDNSIRIRWLITMDKGEHLKNLVNKKTLFQKFLFLRKKTEKYWEYLLCGSAMYWFGKCPHR